MTGRFQMIPVFCAVVFSIHAERPVFAQDCSAQLLGVPDFDQVRQGLAPNNGNSACLPTSGANWLAYIANHGYPEVLDGPRNWQAPEHYDYVTNVIQVLAELMKVNNAGTNFNRYQETMQIWLDNFAPGAFAVQGIGSGKNYAPSPQQLYATLELGWLPVLAFGGYDPHPELVSVFTRTGGHVVSLSKIFDTCGSAPRIWIRNPKGCCDGTSTTQAPFTYEEYDLVPITGIFGGNPTERTMWRRILHSGDGISILDGVQVIIPVFGLSVDSGHAMLHSSSEFTVQPRTASYDIPAMGRLFGLVQEPARPNAIIFGGDDDGRGTLWRLDLVSGKFDELANFAGPGPMVFGRNGDLYLYSESRLLGLDLNVSPPEIQNELRDLAPPQAMAYDHSGDRLLFVANDRSHIGVAERGEDDGLYLSEMRLPPEVRLGDGPLSMSVSPRDASLWIGAENEDLIVRMEADPSGQLVIGDVLSHEAIVAPRNLQVTSRGTVLFTSKSILHELKRDPRTGEWRRAADVPFVGEQVGENFVVSPSIHVPAEYSGGPSDINIVPPPGDGRGACSADLNGDGVANRQDFTLLFAALKSDDATRTIMGDFNGDGAADIADLIAFRDTMSDAACLRVEQQLLEDEAVEIPR